MQLEWGIDSRFCHPLAHRNHEDGAKRISNSTISTVDHCYWSVTFKLRFQFETTIVSNHMSCYFKIFKLHFNIFPISESTVTEQQLYYIQTADCSHPNRLLCAWAMTLYKSICTKKWEVRMEIWVKLNVIIVVLILITPCSKVLLILNWHFMCNVITPIVCPLPLSMV